MHIYDRKDVRNDLLTQLNEAEEFLKRHLNIRSEIRGFDRYDIYELPQDALREALVNALVHRTVSSNLIYYIVTGGGGAELHPQLRQSPDSQVFVEKHHFCRLKVVDNALAIEALDPDLNLLDAFQIKPRKRVEQPESLIFQ